MPTRQLAAVGAIDRIETNRTLNLVIALFGCSIVTPQAHSLHL
jgi:hypothetical protein